MVKQNRAFGREIAWEGKKERRESSLRSGCNPNEKQNKRNVNESKEGEGKNRERH